MPVEITGLVNHNAGSMLTPRPVSDFDLDAILRYAKVQEAAGYDRVLIANSAIMPDNLNIATYVAANTTRLQMMIAQRPGFIVPTMAARMLATIDQISRGRATMHVIAGASDAELKADGDYLTKDERYARCQEYVGILRKLWSSTTPVTHAGQYYKFEKAFVEVKPYQRDALRIFWGGSSDTAIDVGVQCADDYALTGDTLAGARDMIAKVRIAATRHGRMPRFLMTLVVIVGETEAAAWDKAEFVLNRVLENRAKKAAEQAGKDKTPGSFGDGKPVSVSFQRVLENAKAGARVDKCFWTGLTSALQGQAGNVSTLVGTAAQVADSLADYYDLGIGNFLIRGYWPFEDAEAFGRDLIPRLKDIVAQRDRRAVA